MMMSLTKFLNLVPNLNSKKEDIKSLINMSFFYTKNLGA